MKATVHLYGRFREAAGAATVRPDLPSGCSVGTLYSLLGIEESIYRMALVNGIRVQDTHLLGEGDEVHLFQPVGGG